MDKHSLIDILNRDFQDEHAAVIRYLAHGWMEGEDTPLGSSLISISREEMWHMHWLGSIIGELGGEPNFIPAHYPFDPTSRSTMLRSYIEYEERLVPHYNAEADKVDDHHIKRVLKREAWESAIHMRKFQRKLGKLSPEEASVLPGKESELPMGLIDSLQKEVSGKYTEMLQHLRTSWVFQKNAMISWRIMDQAMEKMRHLAHFAESIAEDGILPQFKPGRIVMETAIVPSLKKAAEDVMAARKQHLKLKDDVEVKKHSGLVINMDLTVQQEEYQGAEITGWIKDIKDM
ncbi:ferritin-like domain-containing protein [bacterium]|nr:ferritin-like domain-containing protein [bacterium]